MGALRLPGDRLEGDDGRPERSLMPALRPEKVCWRAVESARTREKHVRGVPPIDLILPAQLNRGVPDQHPSRQCL